MPQEWKQIASKSGTLPDGASITAAELEGASSVVAFLRAYFHNYESACAEIAKYPHMYYGAIQILSLVDMV